MKRTNINMPAALAILALSTTALAGCIDIPGASTDCPGPVETRGTGDQPFAGQELKVLTHGAWDWTYDAVRPQFENDTGAKLTQIAAADAGGALQEAILNKGNPVADVIWGIDNALFHKAKDEGVFQPYTSPNAGRIHGYIDVEQFQDEDGTFIATPADHGYINVNYDIALEQDSETQPPRTLEDLATEEWAPTFVTQDPRTSSPGLGFLIATVATFGDAGDYTWKDYWRDLFTNGVLITDGWTEAYTYHYSANGFGTEGAALDKMIVTSYTTSPAAEVYYGSFDEVNAVSLEPKNGIFHQIETVGILTCAKHPDLAQEFIDYVLTPEFQSTIPDTQAIYPIIQDVDMPETYAELATDPEDLEPAPFTAEELGLNVERWVQEWEAIFQDHYA